MFIYAQLVLLDHCSYEALNQSILGPSILSDKNSCTWQVNGAGDHLLRSLLGNLVLYYPINQYKYVKLLSG